VLGGLLHVAFQNQGIEPGVLMGLRGRSDAIPPGERAFILASTQMAIEDGYTPVKNSSFGKSKNN